MGQVKHSWFWIGLVFFLTLEPIGLNLVDKEGFSGFGEINATVFLRVFVFCIVFFLTCIAYFHVVFVVQNISKRQAALFILFVLSVMVNFSVSSPKTMKAVFFYAEILVSFMAVYAIFLSAKNGRDLAFYISAGFFLATLSLLVIMSIIWFASPDLVIGLETQARLRLGGSVVSPNTLAAIMACSVMSVIYLVKTYDLSNYISVMWVAVAGILVAMTDSRTGLVLLLVAMIVWFFDMRYGRFFIFSIAVAGIVVLLNLGVYSLIGLVGEGANPIEDLLSLNNRVGIFVVALAGIGEYPLFGVGYVEGASNFIAQRFSQSFWVPAHTHNSYLELALAFGLPTAGAMLFLVFRAVVGLLRDKYFYFLGGQLAVICCYGLTAVPFGAKHGALSAMVLLLVAVHFKSIDSVS